MAKKLLSALMISSALVAPGAALADPPNLCSTFIFGVRTPGDLNQLIKENNGTPGDRPFGFAPNEWAASVNLERWFVCGKQQPF